MSVSVDVRGVKEVQRSLDRVSGAPMKRTLQRATNASAKFLKPLVQAESPRKTGKLRKSISAGQAKRGRPASIVKARPKIAFYRHMVMGGTKPHRIRFPDQKRAGVPKSQGNIQHPGARANPFIDRVAQRYHREAVAVAHRVIAEEMP